MKKRKIFRLRIDRRGDTVLLRSESQSPRGTPFAVGLAVLAAADLVGENRASNLEAKIAKLLEQ